jgi:hypothetical protein
MQFLLTDCGCNSTGGVESEKRVAALEKLMAGHAKGLEQRKLLVRYETYWNGGWACASMAVHAVAGLL